MRVAWLVVILGACGGSSPEPPPTGPITAEVLRYDYTFDLESRDATARVELRAATAGDCVTLPMRANLRGDDAELGGAPATAEQDGDQVTVCGEGWEAGTELTLSLEAVVALETWEDSQVGYSISTDAGGEPFYYLVSWVGGCDRFGPCDHAPDRFARYRFTIRHPEGVSVLCPGEVTAGDTETTCDFDHDGGPTYSTFGVVASPNWTVSSPADWNGLSVTIHNRTGSLVEAGIDAEWQAGFLDSMETRFGPYPFGDTLRVITGPTFWAGFEHPGNIVLDDGLGSGGPIGGSPYADPINHTLAHELAHQWAGDQTTLAGTYDFVWKEAMAEYLSFVYEDETDPAVGARTAIAWRGFARGAAFYPVPEEEPPLLDYYGEVYGPGPMILFRQLEALFSRAQVLDAIGALLGAPAARSVDDVQAALEEALGVDLSGYFGTWVRGTGAPTWPQFSVDVADLGGGEVSVTVAQVSPASPSYGCAFAVELQGAAPEERAEVWIDLGVDGAGTVEETASPGFAVTATRLDPHGSCLAFPAPAVAAARHPRGWTPWRGY